MQLLPEISEMKSTVKNTHAEAKWDIPYHPGFQPLMHRDLPGWAEDAHLLSSH